MRKMLPLILVISLVFLPVGSIQAEGILSDENMIGPENTMGHSRKLNMTDLASNLADAIMVDTQMMTDVDRIYCVGTFVKTAELDCSVNYLGQSQIDYEITYYKMFREVDSIDNIDSSTYYHLSGNKWDYTGSALFSVTVYYTESTIGRYTYRQMTSVEGYCSVVDEQMTLYAHNILVGEVGKTSSNALISRSETYNLPTQSSSWTYALSATEFPAIRMVAATQGVTYTITLRRGTGSRWSDSIQLSIADFTITY